MSERLCGWSLDHLQPKHVKHMSGGPKPGLALSFKLILPGMPERFPVPVGVASTHKTCNPLLLCISVILNKSGAWALTESPCGNAPLLVSTKSVVEQVPLSQPCSVLKSLQASQGLCAWPPLRHLAVPVGTTGTDVHTSSASASSKGLCLPPPGVPAAKLAGEAAGDVELGGVPSLALASSARAD